ncbi:amidase [Rhodococcus wratislaviensis]|uniref:amidase n=1 Tax=Rhodococcus wratislaviensis NBRC 100605 TaxID=1219028 RepID=X0Q9V3_RHOWR|nr:amidase [Rhodococcus wratislaviensis]GAF47711.1 putative amidase [Rhodococcus wratislaviensis NBRC 100605]
METSLSALAESVASGELPPSEVVADALERLDRTEPDIRAWVRVDRTRALDAARRLDSTVQKGPLHGIPFGVKDIIDVRGLPTECGSPLRRGRVAADDAHLVARLRELGAIPLGKTVTTEFAYFAPGPTRNPRRLSHTPGGSSSGSAAAVASGVVPLALGSQTAGSLTRPASYCGVAGLVAPVGGPLVTTGFAGLSHTLDAPGILTRTVADVRLAYLALTGPDRLADPVRDLECPRLAVWSGIELVDISDDMQTAVRHTVEAAVADGAELVDFDWPAVTPRLAEAHGTVMAYEASRALASEGRHPAQLSAPLDDLLTQGRSITDRDYQDALAVAAWARSAILTLLTDVDAIIGPAAPGAAPEGLSATGSPILSRPWQLLGLPALTVPGRFDGQGMPLGIQLIGHPERLDRLFALGHTIEHAAHGRH